MIGLDREESGNGGIGDERINHSPGTASSGGLEYWRQHSPVLFWHNKASGTISSHYRASIAPAFLASYLSLFWKRVSFCADDDDVVVSRIVCKKI